MNAVWSALVVGVSVLALRTWLVNESDGAADRVPKLSGIIVDEDGRPLKGVKVRVSGVEKKLSDGKWDRNRRCAFLMPQVTIDDAGRFTSDESAFTLPSKEQEIRVNLWFEKDGYAPTFVYGVRPDKDDLKVVMEPGIQIAGNVRRSIKGKLESVDGAAVELRLASDMETQRRAFRDPLTYVLKEGGDLPYRHRVFTDSSGEYVISVPMPPEGKKWFVVCMDEAAAIGLSDERHAKGPDFVVAVEARHDTN
jgi:hypothetical protein